MSIQIPSLADQPFYEAILRGIGAPVTSNTLASLYAWRQTEGGNATYNPFNTTHKLEGSTLYAGSSHGVQNYPTPQAGLEATLKTLQNGRYDSIIAALQLNATPETFANAVIGSPWGTGNLLKDVVAMFRRGKVVVAKLAEIPGGIPLTTLAEGRPPEANALILKEKERNYWWILPVAASAVTVGVVVWSLRRRSVG